MRERRRLHDMTQAETRKHRILFLAANPQATDEMALDKERKAIAQLLRIANERDRFELHTVWAARVDDVMHALNEWKPTIVHFSGHGASSADVRAEEGTRNFAGDPREGAILLHSETDLAHPVGAAALARILQAASPATRIVVLNACYSEEMGRRLSEAVDCVVGMRGAIGDEAARDFSAGFYRALGFGKPISNVIAQARARLGAGPKEDSDPIVCHLRPGLSLDDITLDPSALFEQQFRVALEQYLPARRATRDHLSLLTGRLQGWLEHHRFQAIQLGDNWPKKSTRHESETDPYLSICVPTQLEDDVCKLELGFWWTDGQRPTVYACFHGVPWRFRLLPRSKHTQVDRNNDTTYLTRALSGDNDDAIVNDLLDELEQAAHIARG